MRSQLILLIFFASSAHAQLAPGDTREQARGALSNHGVHFDSLIVNGKLKNYTADSIQRALTPYATTVYFSNDTVTKIKYETLLDSSGFRYKYQQMLTHPAVMNRFDDGRRIKVQLSFPEMIVYVGYDRRTMLVTEEEKRK